MPFTETRRSLQLFLRPLQNKLTRPSTAHAIPLTSSHVVLSVGEPVKVRDSWEPKELLELIPSTSSTTPAARSATANPIANPRFIIFQAYYNVARRLRSAGVTLPTTI